MVRIEIGVMVQQCLDRRIPDKDTLVAEVARWERRRNAEGAKIKWLCKMVILGDARRASSRSVCFTRIVVPCCVRAGIDIRNKGAEPLNNQPFLRADRISTNLNVKANAVEELTYLCECIAAVDFLEDRSALEALAAFLRARLEASGKAAPMVLGTGVLDLPELSGALDEFIAGDNEGGKIGQAVVPAILDLVFDDVRTKAINDPSSKWPGDVGAFADGAQILAVEVKQRAFSEAEVLLFAQRLQEIGLHRGFIAAFDQASAPLEQEQLHFQARRLYGVELSFFLKPSAFLVEACRYAPRDVPLSLTAFPHHAVKRMEQLEVSAKRLSEWTSLFASPPPAQ